MDNCGVPRGVFVRRLRLPMVNRRGLSSMPVTSIKNTSAMAKMPPPNWRGHCGTQHWIPGRSLRLPYHLRGRLARNDEAEISLRIMCAAYSVVTDEGYATLFSHPPLLRLHRHCGCR
jgi:hypothetical protein